MTGRRTGHFRSRVGRTYRKQLVSNGDGVVAEPFELFLDFTDWNVLPSGTLQYSENFSSIGANWDTTNQGGLTTGNDGDVDHFNETTLRLPAAATGYIVLKNSVFSQSDMVATFRWHRAAAGGIFNRRAGLMVGVRCADNGDGYWITDDGSGNPIIRLIKRVSGINTVIQGGSQTDSGGAPGDVMLSVVGICKDDHVAFFLYSDSDFTDLRRSIDVYDSSITGSGSIGIGGFVAASHDEFADYLEVYDYAAPASVSWERNYEFFGMGLAPSSRYGSVFSDDIVVMHRFLNSRDWTKAGVVDKANVKATLRVSENQTRLTASVGLRLDANGDGYWGGTVGGTSVTMEIKKRVSGVFTTLVQFINFGAPTINTEYKIEFSADGTSLQCRLLDSSDNVVDLGSGDVVVSTTDSTFTGAGEVGVGRMNNNTVGIEPTAITSMKDLTIVEL